MANTTLHWQMRNVLPHLNKGGRYFVLTAYILRANQRNRAWPSIETLIKDTGLGKTTVIAAKKWLEDHGAIRPVALDKREGDEIKLHRLVDVFELTGVLAIDGKEYHVLYFNEVGSDSEPNIGSYSERSNSDTEGIKESLEDITNTSLTAEKAPPLAQPPNGKQPKPKRPRTMLEIAVITQVFGLLADSDLSKGNGFLVGRIHNLLKRHKQSAEDLSAFIAWYKTKFSAALPHDYDKFERHYLAYLNDPQRTDDKTAALISQL